MTSTQPMPSGRAYPVAGDPEYVVRRYRDSIRYYWRAASRNKRAYRWSRYLTIVLGAIVTLVTSIGSADFVQQSPAWLLSFKIGTPILAAALTMIGGFSQTFQWDACWREMVLTAETLEKELDRILVTPVEHRDSVRDLSVFNEIVLRESRGFFERSLGRTPAPQGSEAGVGAAGAEPG